MSTSDPCRIALRYALAAAFTAVFGMVYEHFSFGVYSPFMLYAFMAPLLLGVIPFLLLALRRGVPRPGTCFWHCGVAAITTGYIFQGIISIYGTDSAFTWGYWIAGSTLLLAGIIPRKQKKQEA